MRITIRLIDDIYTRLRVEAASRGLRGFSAIVEEAVERLLDQGGDSLASELEKAEGAWSESDVTEWERERREAWMTYPVNQYSTSL